MGRLMVECLRLVIQLIVHYVTVAAKSTGNWQAASFIKSLLTGILSFLAVVVTTNLVRSLSKAFEA